MNYPEIVFRSDIQKDDIAGIREILTSSGFFYHEEIEIGVELALDGLENGNESSYSFILADSGNNLAGYTCFGEIPCTFGSFDLYWIAVHPDFQRSGIGEKLLNKSEQAASQMGCRRLYIETSARELYRPTQKFYMHCNYVQEAFLEDYYADGDGKIIYVKKLNS
jgi:ribosomal protein S18 acetylase RimI-like enzyme